METPVLQTPTLLYLSKSDITRLGGNSSQLYLDAVYHALTLHARGEIVQPLKPYLRWGGDESHIADRIIAMPAYLGGADAVAGLKWVGSRHDNPSRYGIDRASALIILNDPEANYPIAILEGSLISGMRTAAVTALAAKCLATTNFHRVTCIGCGPIARMQLLTLLEQFPTIAIIHLFDLNPAAAQWLVTELHQSYPQIEYQVAETAKDAVQAGEVVITCTTTDKPYLPFEWLHKGTFISNISIMDVHKDVFLKADKVVVDDWDQCNREKKVLHELVQEGHFSRGQLHAELGQILIGQRPGRESNEEIILLNPIGIAIEDVACAHAIYQKALSAQVGIQLDLY